MTVEVWVLREVEEERDEARDEVWRLRVVGQLLCNEARAWLDGPATVNGDALLRDALSPATTNGDALLRDAIDLWEKTVK